MDLIARAVEAAASCASTSSPTEKRTRGQYFSPPEVASFMARQFEVVSDGSSPVRILDAGAGVGVLGLAASLHFLRAGCSSVHLVAVESERSALRELRRVLESAAAQHAGRLTFEVLAGDFLSLAQPTLGGRVLHPFDCVISNPPYFKMSPSDRHGGDSPNAYARFMDVGANLLKPGGQLVFIVPRSFAAGLYFKRFRRAFHARMSVRGVHSFASRRDAFKDQGVLQENIVVKYVKSAQPPTSVRVTSSAGIGDLQSPWARSVPFELLFWPKDPLSVLHLPASDEDIQVLEQCRGWRSSLRGYGLEISTGPVVPFRSRDHLRQVARGAPTVPLLWMHHVRVGDVTWPLGSRCRKPEYILASAPRGLLVPNRTYVLLRRFSAKEQVRRLTAAVLEEGALPGAWVGLENHLNFIHQPSGRMGAPEATGLAALLNSRLLDRYFRSVNGNTQVNATEIRGMRLPPFACVREIGGRLLREPDIETDDVVEEVLRVQGRSGEEDPEGSWDAPATTERERGAHLARDGRDRSKHAMV